MTRLTDRLHARYGAAPSLPASPAPESALPVLEHLLAHRSVRHFTDAPLAAGTLETLVAAAQSAASSSNLQTWSVVAVTDPQRKAHLAQWAAAQAHIRQVPLFLVWLADLSRLERVARERGAQAGATRYFEMFLTAAIDATLAAQNAVLAAEAMGLGTVYIGAIRNRPEEVAAELKLPPLVFPVFGLCVGHPDPAQPAGVKPRLAQTAIVHREQYDAGAEADAVRSYDEVIQAFQRDQRMAPVPWSQQSSQRVAGPESLSGRHRLAEAIRARGFGLE